MEGIGDLPGVGGLEGRRLGFVEGILGDVHRVGGISLGPLARRSAAFASKSSRFSSSLARIFSNCSWTWPRRLAHAEASSSFTVVPRVFIS